MPGANDQTAGTAGSGLLGQPGSAHCKRSGEGQREDQEAVWDCAQQASGLRKHHGALLITIQRIWLSWCILRQMFSFYDACWCFYWVVPFFWGGRKFCWKFLITSFILVQIQFLRSNCWKSILSSCTHSVDRLAKVVFLIFMQYFLQANISMDNVHH